MYPLLAIASVKNLYNKHTCKCIGLINKMECSQNAIFLFCEVRDVGSFITLVQNPFWQKCLKIICALEISGEVSSCNKFNCC